MPFKCPKGNSVSPVSNLFSFDFAVNMSGNYTTNYDYSTKAITFGTKTIPYDILKINFGVNDPLSKHYPKILTWKNKKIKKHIKLFGKKFDISVNIPAPTQTYNEIYTKKESIKIIFFTIEPFKFKINATLSFSGNMNNNFTMSVSGIDGCLLQLTTAGLIDDYFNDGNQILSMSTSDQTTRIINMLEDPKFLEYAMGATLLTYLLRDGLCAKYTILKAGGKIKFALNNLNFEYGDLKIAFPSFNIDIDIPDLLKDPITGQTHTVSVSGNATSGLIVTVQLIVIENLDFFELIITGLQNTLKLAQNATGTSYNPDYVKELEDILAQLQNADDSVTNWITKYLGMTCTITISFVFCPAGMASVPPTPFFLDINLTLNINPYKILDDLFDSGIVIEEAAAEFENDFLNDVKSLTNDHTIDNMLKSALNTVNKELITATKAAKDKINNKYLNKVYTVSFNVYIPIEPG